MCISLITYLQISCRPNIVQSKKSLAKVEDSCNHNTQLKLKFKKKINVSEDQILEKGLAWKRKVIIAAKSLILIFKI